jgi:hypothetical protein
MKYLVILLAIIGFANFTVINKSAFRAMSKTILTEKGKNIPSRLYNDLTTHHWRFILGKTRKKR